LRQYLMHANKTPLLIARMPSVRSWRTYFMRWRSCSKVFYGPQ
jgi:hypothetical protein